MFTSNNYKEVVTKLKFINKIQPGEKMNTRPSLSIVNDDWMASILRKFYNFESRAQTVQFINETVSSAFQIVEQIKITARNSSVNTDITTLLNNLYKDLSNAKIGITNLISTYKTDKNIVAQLETVMENIDLFLEMNNVTI